MLVRDKTIVVCGVGPGLGREVAEAALRDGARVVIAARRAEALSEQAKTLDPSGERVLAVPTDIADDDQCVALMAAAQERFGSVDGVVQVAALDTAFGDLDSTSAEDWSKVMGINVVGTIQVVRAAAPGAAHNTVNFRKGHFDKHVRAALHSSVPCGGKAATNQ